MTTLYLAWQNQQSRLWFPVGRLIQHEFEHGGYEFAYVRGAEQAKKLAKFREIPGFPQLYKHYLSVCAFTLIGLHAFAVYLLPDLLPASWHFLKRTWGFHFLTFYPPYLALCAYAVAVAVAVPQINLTISKHLESIIRRVKVNKTLLWGVLCLIFGVLCFLFKQKYAFLGDGYLMPAKIVEGTYTPYSKNLMFLVMHVHKWGAMGRYGHFWVKSLYLVEIMEAIGFNQQPLRLGILYRVSSPS